MYISAADIVVLFDNTVIIKDDREWTMMQKDSDRSRTIPADFLQMYRKAGMTDEMLLEMLDTPMILDGEMEVEYSAGEYTLPNSFMAEDG